MRVQALSKMLFSYKFRIDTYGVGVNVEVNVGVIVDVSVGVNVGVILRY